MQNQLSPVDGWGGQTTAMSMDGSMTASTDHVGAPTAAAPVNTRVSIRQHEQDQLMYYQQQQQYQHQQQQQQQVYNSFGGGGVNYASGGSGGGFCGGFGGTTSVNSSSSMFGGSSDPSDGCGGFFGFGRIQRHQNHDGGLDSDSTSSQKRSRKKPVKAEKQMGDEWTKLTAEERERAYEDLHGIPNALKETPEFLTMKLAEFDSEIHKLMTKERNGIDGVFRSHRHHLRKKKMKNEMVGITAAVIGQTDDEYASTEKAESSSVDSTTSSANSLMMDLLNKHNSHPAARTGLSSVNEEISPGTNGDEMDVDGNGQDNERSIPRLSGHSLMSSSSPSFVNAYDMALNIDESYVRDTNRRLSFLRADQFDTPKAAKRYLRHFEAKLDLFGPSKLTKDITISDLGDDGYQMLLDGSAQIIPKVDRSGRTIVFGMPCLKSENWSITGMMKSHYYLMMKAVEDNPLAQQLGFIFCLWTVNDTHIEKPHLSMVLIRLREALPIRTAATHFCTNHQALYVEHFMSFCIKAFESMKRVRLRIHYGSPTEVFYSLLQFGLPVGNFPIDISGSSQSSRAVMTNHYQWMELCRTTDTTKNPEPQHRSSLRMSFSSRMDPLITNNIEMIDGMDDLIFHDSFDLEDEDIGMVDTAVDLSNVFDSGVHSTDADMAIDVDDDNQVGPEQVVSNDPGRDDTVDTHLSSNMTRAEDVLLGRGRPLQSHFGNVQLRRWIEEHHVEYEKTNKRGKTEMTQAIVSEIQKSGGRFLKQTDNDGKGNAGEFWVPIDDQTARLKVAYGFRTFRKSTKKSTS